MSIKQDPERKIQMMLIVMIYSVKLIGIKKTMRLFIKKVDDDALNKHDGLECATRLLTNFRQARDNAHARFKGNCLPQSLTLHWLLRKNNLYSTMHFGVKLQPAFKAHAWIEYKGTPLNAHPDVRKRYQSINKFNLKLNNFS